MSSPTRVLSLLLLALLPAVALLLGTSARAAEGPPAARAACAVRIELGGILTAATSDYVADAVAAAEAGGCALLVVIDTPGGELEATRRIVQSFYAARVPVIAFVSPSGARAGSAGMFVTLAAHVAAMAPGTTIGAAHPVLGTGQDPEEVGGKHLARKIENDTAAFARAIAQRRGRNAAWAEAAVRESVSVTAAEARARDVIDRIAGSEAELLEALDGAVVATAAGPLALATRDATVREHAMSVAQRVRSAVANPSVVYLLFMIGAIGLLIELTSPGLIVPGVVGGFALVLAAIGMDVLPVRAGAAILMAAGAGLLIAEVFVTAYGLLALAGAGVLALGASFLIDHEAGEVFTDARLGISWELVVPFVVVAGAVAAALAWRARQIRSRPAVTGGEALIGSVGRVVAPIGDEPGLVLVAGERWRATADAPIPSGRAVRVDDVHGVTLHVTPVSPAGGMP